jgi:hypothetical protein
MAPASGQPPQPPFFIRLFPLAEAFTTFVHETPAAPAVDDETAGAGGVGAGVDVGDVLDEGLAAQPVVLTLERGMPFGTDRGVRTIVQPPGVVDAGELCADATLGKNVLAKTAMAAEKQREAIEWRVLLDTGILLRADARRHGARRRGIPGKPLMLCGSASVGRPHVLRQRHRWLADTPFPRWPRAFNVLE